MHFRGPLYCALNPLFAREPLSGQAAEIYGGRFNPKGVPALYASLNVSTALREANRVGALQPTTLVSYDADIADVFDTRDGAALEAQAMTGADLADAAWRDQMKSNGESKTQAFARRLIAGGRNGLLVRSFAPGAREDDLNLVLWRWGAAPPSRLKLIDDENRFA